MEPEIDNIFMTKEELFERLENETGVFANDAVKAAFHAIDRKDFLEPDYEIEAYEDYAVPIGEGSSISQPTTVAFMLELLNAQDGDIVLDIGSGSGWTTALLGHMVGSEGRVIGLEINPVLVERGQKNIKKYKDLPIEIRQADDETGLYKEGPYNRILVSAAFLDKETAPVDLLLQLANGGVMVAPIGNSIFKFEKNSEDEIVETEYPGFTFVPYIS
jgi:protein-L-isoaspartate(D-aspartate) O-methyltransferase